MRATRRVLLTFERILCGYGSAATSLPWEVSHDKLVSYYARGCSGNDGVGAVEKPRSLLQSAPLPVPVAAPLIVSLLSNDNTRCAGAAQLLSHPQQGALLAVIATSSLSLANLLALLAMIDGPTADTKAVATLLASLAEFCHAATLPSSSGNDTAANEQCEFVRGRIVRHLNDHLDSVSVLLGSLCLVSKSTERSHVQAVVSTLMRGVKADFVSPDSFASVLRLLVGAQQWRRVGALWGWMRHTSARWDREAASAALLAYVELQRIDDVVECVKGLSEVGEVPSVLAQAKLVRFLAHQVPSLTQYADQLVAQWYPYPRGLWEGGFEDGDRTASPQEVGAELILAHFFRRHHQRVVDLLEDACNTLRENTQAIELLLCRPGIANVIRHLAPRTADLQTLRYLFYDVPLRAHGLEQWPPSVLGAVVLCAQCQGRLPEMLQRLERMEMDEASVAGICKYIAEERAINMSPEDTLKLLEEVARSLRHSVPSEVSAWLELLRED